jgi:hypothetical protein
MKNCYYILNDTTYTLDQVIDYINNNLDFVGQLDNNILLHEAIHPFIDEIYDKDEKSIKKIYNSYIMTTEGKQVLSYVQLNYPYLSGKELIAEVLTRGVHEEVKKDRPPKSWFLRLMDVIKQWLGIEQDLSKFTTINDLAVYLDESFQAKRKKGIDSFRRRSIDNLSNVVKKINDIITSNQKMKLKGTEESSVYVKDGKTYERVSNFIKDMFLETSQEYNEEEYIDAESYNKLTKIVPDLFYFENGKYKFNNSLEVRSKTAKFIADYNKWVEEVKKDPDISDSVKKTVSKIKITDFNVKSKDIIGDSIAITKRMQNQLKQYVKADLQWKKNISLVGTAVHKGFEVIITSMGNSFNRNITKEEVFEALTSLDELPVQDDGTKKFKDIDDLESFKSLIADTFLTRVLPVIPKDAVHVYPELKITGVGDTGLGNVAGTIDLLVIDSKGDAHIIDYKTSLKPREFWSKSKDKAVQAQMATYAHMLAENGINVSTITPIPIQLTVNHTNVDKGVITSFKNLQLDNKSGVDVAPRNIKTLGTYRNMQHQLNSRYGTPLLNKGEVSIKNKPIRNFMKKYFNYESLTDDPDDIAKQKAKKKERAMAKGYFFNAIERKVIRSQDVNDYEKLLDDYLEYTYSQKQDYGLLLSNYFNMMQIYSLQNRFRPDQLNSQYTYNNKPMPEPSFDFTGDYDDSEYRKVFNSAFSKYWSEFKAEYDPTTKHVTYVPLWTDVSTPESLELGIVMMLNTETNVIDFLNLHPKPNEDRDILNNTSFSSMPIFGEKVSSGSIAGNFLNAEQDNMYNLMDARYGNIEAIKTYLFIINQKFNSDRKIGSIVSISNQVTSKPTIMSITKVDRDVKKLIEVSGETTDMDDAIKSYNSYANRQSVRDRIIDIYSFYQSRFIGVSNIGAPRAAFQYKLLNNLKAKPGQSVGTLNINNSIDNNFYNDIVQRQQELERQRMEGRVTEEDLYELKLLNELILTVGNIELYADEGDMSRLSKSITPPDEVRSPMFQSIRSIVLNMRQRFKMAYNKYFDKIREEFAEYYKEKGKLTSLTTSNHFNNLYEYEEIEAPDGTIKIRNTFRLRDPYDQNYDYKKFNQTELTNAERNLVSKMIENLREMRADDNLDDVTVRELPLIEKSASAKFAESVKKGNFKEALLSFKNSFNETIAAQNENERSIDDNNVFKAKIKSSMMYQKDPKNRQKMLDETQQDQWETDIESLYLWANYQENKTREWNKSLPQIMAARSMISMSNFVWHKNFPEITDLMDTFIRTNVFGKAGLKEEEEMLARNISAFKSAVTLQQLGLSARTSFIQLLSTMFSTLPILNGGIGSDRVTRRGVMKAMRFVFNPDNEEFLLQLRLKYNMDNMNVESMLYARRQQITGMAWASSNMMWFNAIGDQKFREIMFIAQMIHDGVIDIEGGVVTDQSSVYLDGKELVYDYTKDKRYANMDVDSDQRAMFEFRSKLAKEQGTYDYDNDKPTIAYTFEELRSKHKLLNDAYADMTSENKSVFEKSVWGILFFQFRKWIQSKKNLYYTDFNNPIKTLADAGEWVIVKDKDGNILRDEQGNPIVRWQGRLHEGILNTLFKVTKSLIEDPANILNTLKGLQDFQKRNLKHLANDLGLLLFLLLLKELFSWEEEKKDRDALDSLLSLTYSTMADSTIFAIASDVSVNSPFVMVSILKRTVEGIFGNLLEGDFAGSGESLLRSFGISRSIMQISEIVTDSN